MDFCHWRKRELLPEVHSGNRSLHFRQMGGIFYHKFYGSLKTNTKLVHSSLRKHLSLSTSLLKAKMIIKMISLVIMWNIFLLLIFLICFLLLKSLLGFQGPSSTLIDMIFGKSKIKIWKALQADPENKIDTYDAANLMHTYLQYQKKAVSNTLYPNGSKPFCVYSTFNQDFSE